MFNITLCLISLLWKCLWWKAFCFLKEKCIIPDLQSLKNTTIPFNALSFKAEKITEISFDTFYSKLKDLFQFRKHEHTFRRKKRIQRKSPTYVMHHCLNTIKITPEATWGFSAELQRLVHQSLDIQMEVRNPL